MRVTILVLGDLGRSPRMLYHAEAFAARGDHVDLVGFVESPLPSAVTANDGITVHTLPHGRRDSRASKAAYAVASLRRAAGLWTKAFRLLVFGTERADVLLIQNPPAIPTLPVANAVARLRGSKLVIDWHNFGFSMLGLRLGVGHPAVRAAERYERSRARRANAHLCVSDAMRARLTVDWQLPNVSVFYDRPAAIVRADPDAGREAIDKLTRVGAEETSAGRPQATLVSSTSWTADEDFGLLVEAVRRCETKVAGSPGSPTFTLAVTGEGERRAEFEAAIRRLALKHIDVRTGWLDVDDYRALLASADLGICLHRSASGVDLPMKVLDMFGAGLPVAALDYGPCLSELVRNGENGSLFRDAASLAELIGELFDSAASGAGALGTLREGVRAHASKNWRDGWLEEAAPVFSIP